MAEVFSVDGGKFHRPARPIDPEDRGAAWKPTQTACGVTVRPQNYFETAHDAALYTGDRLHRFGCKKCGLDGVRA